MAPLIRLPATLATPQEAGTVGVERKTPPPTAESARKVAVISDLLVRA